MRRIGFGSSDGGIGFGVTIGGGDFFSGVVWSNSIWKEGCWRYRRQGVVGSSLATESLVGRVVFGGDMASLL